MSIGQNTRSVLGDVAVPAAATTPPWSEPQKLHRLNASGRITHHLFRAPASSNITEVDVMVFVDDADKTFANTFDADTDVPAEHRIFYRTGITVAGSATAADDDHTLVNPADFDLADHKNNDASRTNKALYVSYKGVTGTAQSGCKYRISAQGVD